VAVDEEAIAPATREFAAREGILAAPEGAACILALASLVESGRIEAGERVVVFNTGTGLKYLESIVSARPRA